MAASSGPVPLLRSSQTYVAPPTTDDEYAVRDLSAAAGNLPPGEHSGPVVPVVDLPDEFAVEDRPADEAPSPGKGRIVLPLSERPKLPPRPMIDDVLTFFWHPTSAIFWSASSIGATLMCWFFWRAIVAAGMNVPLGIGTQGAIPAAAPLIVTLVMTILGAAVGLVWLVIVSAHLLAILHDSAAGNKYILNWPEFSPTDWIGAAIYVVISVLMSVGVACLLTWPFGGVFVHWWLVPICVWLLFPIVMLSALEAESVLLPASSIVWQSLRKCGRTWAIFFVQTFLLGLSVLMLTAVMVYFQLQDFGVIVFAGYGMVVEMLYFRLLGRLAWACDEYFRRHPSDEEDEDEERPAPPSSEEEEPPEIHPTPVNDF